MRGLKVQCPGCKKVYHETTEKYDPNIRPNGAMVRLLDPWKGWGWAAFDAEGMTASTTLCSEMLCPGCTAPLAPSGRLTVIPIETTIERLVKAIGEEAEEELVKTKESIADLEEHAGITDQAEIEVTHAEPSTPGLEGGGELPQPTTPNRKKKKKANALKKKAKKKANK